MKAEQVIEGFRSLSAEDQQKVLTVLMPSVCANMMQTADTASMMSLCAKMMGGVMPPFMTARAGMSNMKGGAE